MGRTVYRALAGLGGRILPLKDLQPRVAGPGSTGRGVSNGAYGTLPLPPPPYIGLLPRETKEYWETGRASVEPVTLFYSLLKICPSNVSTTLPT